MENAQTEIAKSAETVEVVSPILDIVTGAGVKGQTAVSIAMIFEAYSEQAEQWLADAAKIEVTDIAQVKEIKLARESRLKLKHIRGQIDKKRRELKEDSQQRGNAIQSAANYLRDKIKPIEAKLQEAEDFEKRYLEELRVKRLVQRTEEVTDLGGSPWMYNLGELSDEQYAELIQGLKDQAAAKAKREADELVAKEKAKAERKAAEKKAEAERAAKEIEQRKERERIVKENARLKAEAEERDRIAAVEKAERDAQAKAERVKREEVAAATRAHQQLTLSRQDELAKLGKLISFATLSAMSDDDYAEWLEKATVAHKLEIEREKSAKVERVKAEAEAEAARAEAARLKTEAEERDRIAAADKRERLSAQLDEAVVADVDMIVAHAKEWAAQNPEVEDGETKFIAAVVTYLEDAASLA